MAYWDNRGAAPTKVTWANPQVVPESQRQNGGWYYNPNSGLVERWWTGDPQESRSQPTSQANNVDSYINTIKDTLGAIVDPKFQEVDKYLKDNPFAYDEEWLSNTEKQVRDEVEMEPYYKEKLSNYLDDVKVTKERAQEDETTLLKELDRQEKVYIEQDTLAYQKARESALEGLSDAGMIGQGGGMRELNRGEVSHETGLQDYLSQKDLRAQQAQQTTSRLLTDLGTEQNRFELDLGREKDLQVQSEIQNRKQDKYNFWEAGLKTAQSGLGGYI